MFMAAVMLTAGMGFMFGWNPLVHHADSWDVGGDAWGIFRAAHYVAWGYLGGVYTASNGVNSLPGMSVLLVPVAMLSSALHLTESDPFFTLSHPTAALLLQPVELLLASTVVFACDSLAERLEVGQRRRAALCVIVAVVAWPPAAIWGHAEDVLAMTFALYAMVAMLDRRWTRCGWLLGLAIVMQPLVALILPLFVAACPPNKRVPLIIRSCVISVILAGIAFLGNPGGTYQALIEQPTPPAVNHPTPWVGLAPVVHLGGTNVVVHGAALTKRSGHPAAEPVTAQTSSSVFVAGGPGRTIDLFLAVLLGVYLWRRPKDPIRVLWFANVVLASRCFFEAVMTPYYTCPPLLLALVLASRQSPRRFWATAVLSLEVTVFGYFHLSPWTWWVPILAGLSGTLALGFPGVSSGRHALNELEAHESTPGPSTDARTLVRAT